MHPIKDNLKAIEKLDTYDFANYGCRSSNVCDV